MGKRPHIICHMVASLDGKVTGKFLSSPISAEACEVYYILNRRYREEGASGFICGRVTMEESFTGGKTPELSGHCDDSFEREWHMTPEYLKGSYAVSFDPKGRVGWESALIEDEDPGYDGTQVIEVLSGAADKRYPSYLESKGIPYFVAGDERIDVSRALELIYERTGAECLLLEGGSIINGEFLRAGCVDELSIVVAPAVADKDDKPLFFGANLSSFELVSAECIGSVPVLRYIKKDARDACAGELS